MSYGTDPLQPLHKTMRRAIRKADPSITQGIKWNIASFYCNGWFASMSVRGKHGVLVVLHQGAKKQAVATLQDRIKDDGELLHWHSADRASLSFTSELSSRRRD